MKSLLISLLFVFAVTVSAETLLEKPGLVSTDWLAEKLEQPDLRIIDARSSLGPYIRGHLPGAIYLNTETFRYSEGGVPARLLQPGQIGEILGGMGISNDHTVVIYSSMEESFSHAAYVAFILEWLGHTSVAVLDGGFEKWEAEERTVTRDFPSHSPEQFEATVNAALLKEADEVRQAIEENGAALLDARNPDLFQAAHLPTAQNYFLRNTLQGDDVRTWKSSDELRALAADADADGSQPIITYCTSGRESAQIWFTLRHVAGFENVSSYHGSLIDWTSKNLPLE